MAHDYIVEASAREKTTSRLRREGFIPAVMYGKGEPSQTLQVDAKAFTKVWHAAGSSSVVNVMVGKKEYPVLIHEVQLHPLKGVPIHIDLYQVRMNETIRTSVPLAFTGESAAVKNLSGILVKNMDALELEALPKDLPHEMTVDIAVLTDFDVKILVSDLVAPKGVTILDEAERVVALVQPPRSEAELESLKEEVKEDVEAVEGVKKEEKPAEGEEAEEAQDEKKE